MALGLIAGIWMVARIHPLAPMPWLSVACGALLTLLVSRRACPRGWYAAVRKPLMVVLIGGGLLSLSLDAQGRAEDAHELQLDDREDELLLGQIDGVVLRSSDRQLFVLQTAHADIWMTVYRERDGAQTQLAPGQWISLRARLARPVGLRAPGTSDRKLQTMARGAQLIATASLDEVRVVSRSFTPWYWAGRAHDWAVRTIASQPGSERGRALVAAIATGDRSAISQDLAAELRVAGIAHLLAVSGMHLAAVASLVFFFVLQLWAWLPWRQRLEPESVAAALALGAALAFTAVTGARPSTCRALLVTALVLGGILLGRRVRLLHALSWAACALLLWRPVLLWDVGFQMSFAAALALSLAFSRPHESLVLTKPGALVRFGHAIGSLLKASFWACMATAPISLYHFGELSWIGLLSNIIAVPLATFALLPSALGGLFASAVVPGGGDFLLSIAIALADLMADGSAWIFVRQGTVMRAPLSLLEFFCWLSLCVLLLRPRRSLGSRRRWPMGALLLLLMVLSRGERLPWQGGSRTGLRVTFVEVGQGDAALIETPGGEVWLIDGGGLPFVRPRPGLDSQYLAESPARRALLPLLRHRRIDHIDLAIVSHPHPDHYVGLQAIAKVLPIAEIWSVHAPQSGPYEDWLDLMRQQNTYVRAPPLGLARRDGDVAVQVLWPRFYASEDRAAIDPILTVNDNSLVVRIDYAGRRLLFSGDIEKEAEELLVELDSRALEADLVKVPHHGSKTSSSEVFVDATRPRVAIISCGRANRFDFPAADVQERWEREARLVLRTDEVGTVTVTISPAGRIHLQTRAPF